MIQRFTIVIYFIVVSKSYNFRFLFHTPYLMIPEKKKTLILDFGTTGIVYQIINSSDNQIETVVYGYKGVVQEKLQSTFMVYSNTLEDVFEETTIMQRSYFGFEEPSCVQQYRKYNPTCTLYMFHGIKQQIYNLERQVKASNINNAYFNTDIVFRSMLKIIYEQTKDKLGNDYQMIFMAPANADVAVQTYLLTIVKDIFIGIQNDNSLITLKEPVAASIYAIEQLKCQGVQILQNGTNNYSRILIIDLGGGTCDFNIVEYHLQDNQHRQLTNMAISVGGSNIDLEFMNLIKTLLPTLSDAYYINILNQFIQEKVKDNVEYYIEIPNDVKPSFQDKIIQNLFKDQMSEILSEKQIQVNNKIIDYCSKPIIEHICNTIFCFLDNEKKLGQIDCTILVGGFSNYKKLSNCLEAKIKEVCLKNYGKQTQFNQIIHKSLAIIMGGCQQYIQNSSVDQILINTFRKVDQNIWFINDEESIQLYQIGLEYDNDKKNINQLCNAKPRNEGADQILVQFQYQNSSDVQVHQKHNLKFLINYSNNSPFKISLDIINGYKLTVIDRNNTEQIYDPYQQGEILLNDIRTSKRTAYILIDCTNSMNTYIKQLDDKLKLIIEQCQRKNYLVCCVSYTDFGFSEKADKSLKVKTINNLKKFLEGCQQKVSMQEQELTINQKGNDMAEDMLSAFEAVLNDKKFNSDEDIIVVIADHCSHGHIGCECSNVKNVKIELSNRKNQLEIHKNCQICMKNYDNLDIILKNYDQLQQTWNAWEQIVQELKNAPIVFVPANDEASTKTISLVNKYKNYKFVSAYNVLKTHRWMYMLGCEKLYIIPESKLDTFVSELVEIFEKIITPMHIIEQK